MKYPWGLEIKADVTIDADDVLSYVENNKEWFLEQLNIQKSDSSIKEDIKSLGNYVDSIIDKYNNVRILRDNSSDNRDNIETRMYEDLVAIRESIRNI